MGKQIIEKLKTDSDILDNLVIIKSGLKAYQNGKGKPKQTKEIVKNRPFDYKLKFDENTHKYLEGKDVLRFALNWSGEYLQFGEHLAEPRIFPGKKLIIREITSKFPYSLIATYTEELYLFNISNVVVLERDDMQIDLKYILAIINSSLLSYYFLLNTAKSVRIMFPKIILTDLRQFPIKAIALDDQRPFISKADTMLSKNRELHELKTDFLNFMKAELKPAKISKKLENWQGLDWESFNKELTKCKAKDLNLQERKEWLSYFTEQKGKAAEIQTIIDSTDREIDQMVYELYGLTEEEIHVVENNYKEKK